MENVEVTLVLKPGSLKKLRALAMLTGRTFEQVEADLSEHFDSMLSQSIRSYVAELDGEETPTPPLAPAPRIVEKIAPARPAPRSFAQAEAQANDVLNAGEDETPGDEHSLSGDDDTGENKSFEEQAAEGTLTLADLPTIPNLPDAGDDAEAFADVAFQAAPTHLAENHRKPLKREPSSGFHPSRPRVSIREYSTSMGD